MTAQATTADNEHFRKFEEQRKQDFARVLELEPRVLHLFERLQGGGIDLNDLWLTYFSAFLQWIVGRNRQDDGDDFLFTEEAFDAVHTRLYYEIPRYWWMPAAAEVERGR